MANDASAGALIKARAQTVQDVPDALIQQGRTTILGTYFRGPLLPPWGTLERERLLRRYDRYEYNTLWQGASAGLGKKIAAVPWEIRGPADLNIAYYQALLRAADFGRGWGNLVKKLVRDFLRYDRGAWIEITGPGHPLGPMLGRPTGMALLDPLRVYPTGDPSFPAVYFNKKGEVHLMHRSRVHQLVDWPDTDTDMPGMGLCALSRAIAIAAREGHMGRYINELLDDNPPPGFMLAGNLTEADVKRAIRIMREGLQTDEIDVLGRTVFLYGSFAENTPTLTSVAMSTPPEKFDFVQYVNLDVNELALALGIDKQELWELTGGNIGSGTQSQVLAQKARGKTPGDLMAELTRFINDLLPEELEFEFKFRDSQEDLERAQIRQTNAATVQTVAANLTPDEIRRFLVMTDDTFRDILTDEAGEVIELDDADVEAEPETVAGEVEPTEAPLGQGDAEAPPSKEQPPQFARGEKVRKAWAVTREAFKNLIALTTHEGLGRNVDRRRFGVVLRAHIRRMGLEAFKDGLEDGGTYREDLDTEDRTAILAYTQEQSQYATKYADAVFKEGLTDAQVMAHARMWANKTLRGFYMLGLKSAAWNGSFQWLLGATEEHCRDCLRLNGQVHRYRHWQRHYLPGDEHLECKGYNCDCRLVRSPGEKAKGRF